MGREQGFKHTEATKEKMRLAKLGKTGELSNAYKNGIGSYRQGRDLCFLRDNKNCKGRLEVHHFDGDRSNNSEDNLLCVCMRHHAVIDPRRRMGGRKRKIDILIGLGIQQIMERFQ